MLLLAVAIPPNSDTNMSDCRDTIQNLSVYQSSTRDYFPKFSIKCRSSATLQQIYLCSHSHICMASVTRSATTRLLSGVQDSNRDQEYDATINLAEVSIAT